MIYYNYVGVCICDPRFGKRLWIFLLPNREIPMSVFDIID